MTNKVVCVFTQFSQGWTESWYHSGPSLSASAALWTNPAVLATIARWRGKGVILSAMRFIDVVNPRASIVRSLNYESDPATTGGPDLTGATAQLNFGTATGKRRIMSVRGMQDNDIRRDAGSGAANPSAALLAALQEYIRQIVLVQFDYIRNLTSTDIIPWVNVVSFQPVAGNAGNTTVTTQAAHGLAEGDLVYFRRVQLNIFPGLRGNFRVVSVTNATQFVIAYRMPTGGLFAPVGTQTRKALYLYDAINAGSFKGFTVRKTGRPFFLTRGRSRGAHLRQ